MRLVVAVSSAYLGREIQPVEGSRLVAVWSAASVVSWT